MLAIFSIQNCVKQNVLSTLLFKSVLDTPLGNSKKITRDWN
jgi:hypothetical protein